MAFYITINKIAESSDDVTYEYFDDEVGKGKLKIIKATGDVTELLAAPGDTSGRRFQRAAKKVAHHWKQGEFPEETCWAS